jgi:hypothetical protein
LQTKRSGGWFPVSYRFHSIEVNEGTTRAPRRLPAAIRYRTMEMISDALIIAGLVAVAAPLLFLLVSIGAFFLTEKRQMHDSG